MTAALAARLSASASEQQKTPHPDPRRLPAVPQRKAAHGTYAWLSDEIDRVAAVRALMPAPDAEQRDSTLMDQLWDALYGPGEDQTVTAGARPWSMSSPDWRDVTTWQALERDLRTAGEGATAFIRWQPPRGTADVLALYHTRDRGPVWLEPDARPGARLKNDTPPRSPAYTRVAVFGADGRLITRPQQDEAVASRPEEKSLALAWQMIPWRKSPHSDGTCVEVRAVTSLGA